jgi:hypothetical protein
MAARCYMEMQQVQAPNSLCICMDNYGACKPQFGRRLTGKLMCHTITVLHNKGECYTGTYCWTHTVISEVPLSDKNGAEDDQNNSLHLVFSDNNPAVIGLLCQYDNSARAQAVLLRCDGLVTVHRVSDGHVLCTVGPAFWPQVITLACTS